MAIDIWRIEEECNIKITHQYHQILAKNMMQKLMQVVPNLGPIGKEWILTLGSIP